MDKLNELLDNMPCPKGFTRIFSYNPETGAISSMVMQPNTIMVGSATCLAHQSAGDNSYKLAYMYMQFENLSSTGDDPVVPSYTAADDISYFTNLSVHGSQDFLRVPLVSAPSYTTTGSGYTDNMITYIALSGGFTSGFHGKPFSDAAISAVFGGALVAAPTGLQAGDIVFARNYPTSAKVLKPAGEQIVMQWSIEFTVPSS